MYIARFCKKNPKRTAGALVMTHAMLRHLRVGIVLLLLLLCASLVEREEKGFE